MNNPQLTPTVGQNEWLNNYNSQQTKDVSDKKFYKDVMLWLLLCVSTSVAATFFIGPLIPPAAMVPLYLVLLVAIIGSAFVKQTTKISGLLAILFSAGIGIVLYPTLNFYIASGSGDIVLMALGGTVVVFGAAAIMGWVSSKSLESWAGKLFVIVLGVIAVSLLNTFFFHVEALYTVISIVVLIVFTLYSFIDIQRIRDRTVDAPASWYALNVFLDIYNIFIVLLQLFGGSRN